MQKLQKSSSSSILSDSQLSDIAAILRRDSLQSITAAKSGHATSCLSCAEIMAVLFFDVMRYDTPTNQANDEFVLSKGHAAPILYAAYYRAKKIKTDLLQLRKHKHMLQGHPIPRYFSWAKMATGSLGQGLSNGVGMALAQRMQAQSANTFVLLGDSELAEGSVWEAVNFAAHNSLSNLFAIVDVNRLGQSGETMFGHDLTAYQKRFEAAGWNVLVIEGNDIVAVRNTFTQLGLSHAKQNSKKKTQLSKPTVILAKTRKGAGISFIADKPNWHGKPLSESELEKALIELGEPVMPKISIPKPKKLAWVAKRKPLRKSKLTPESIVATRQSYGDVIKRIAQADPSFVVVDAEVGNSTFAQAMKEVDESRYIQCYIAEQNMIGVACGLAVKGMNVFCGSFAAFLTRAYDQMRMAGISDVKLTISGSHAGVSIGEDGASQMGLEDLGMCKMVHNSSVFYPSDAVSAEHIFIETLFLPGVKYVRTSRSATKLLYSVTEKFPVGEFKVLAQSKKDSLVIASNGIPLHEVLEAKDILAKEGVSVSVVDCYSLKPFNAKSFSDFVKKHGNYVYVVEEHFADGGLGDTIARALLSQGTGSGFSHQFVNSIPSSGTKDELLADYGLDAKSIVQAVKKMIKAHKL